MNAQVQTGELLNKDEVIKTLPEKFNAVTAGIDTLKQRYTGLRIIGIDDKNGYEAVRTGLAELRSTRVAVEEARSTFKRPLLDIGNAIDAEAKRITAEIVNIEDPLRQEKKRIDDEKDAIKAAKVAEEQRLIREEQEKIARAAREKAEKEASEQAERNRLLAEENARLKAEADKAAAEQKAIADEQKRLADEQAKEIAQLKAEKEAAEAKIRQEQAEKARLEREAQETKKREEQARLDAERAEREAIEREAKALADKLEKEAALQKEIEEREALRIELFPDFEKLWHFSGMLTGLLPALDSINHPIAEEFSNEIIIDIKTLQQKITTWIGE